jgi:hypothetical protein
MRSGKELQGLLDEFFAADGCSWCGDIDRKLYAKRLPLCGSCRNIKALVRMREWLKGVSLSLISRITGIKREHLRAIRSGKPGRRKTLAALADLKHRWINAEQSGSLQRAIAAIRSGGWRNDSEA